MRYEYFVKLCIEKIIKNNLIDGSRLPSDNQYDSDFSLLTLHRPSNVDPEEVFVPLLKFLMSDLAADNVLIWTVHPRTHKQLNRFGFLTESLPVPSCGMAIRRIE